MGALGNLSTPIAFSLTTLAVLWSFSGGNLLVFWQRSVVLAVALAIVVALTPGFSLPILRDFLKKEFWKDKVTKLSLIAGLALAIPFSLALLVLHSSSITAFPWLHQYIQQLSHPTWYAFLLLPLFAIPLWEMFWRGLISPQWGTFTTAFLEGLIWGFAAQHVVFFLAAFLSSILIHFLIYRSYGIRAAILAKGAWTLVLLITLMVL
jgi:hypothetical protein